MVSVQAANTDTTTSSIGAIIRTHVTPPTEMQTMAIAAATAIEICTVRRSGADSRTATRKGSTGAIATTIEIDGKAEGLAVKPT